VIPEALMMFLLVYDRRTPKRITRSALQSGERARDLQGLAEGPL